MKEAYSRKEMFEHIIAAMENGEVYIKPQLIIDFCKSEIGKIKKKNNQTDSNKEMSDIEQQFEFDLINLLSEEDFLTIPQIIKTLEPMTELSLNEVFVGRKLTKLVRENILEKKEVIIFEKGEQKKRTGYRLII